MTIFKTFISLLLAIFFSACSSKTEVSINEQVRSFQVDKDVKIYTIEKTVNSPVSINVGVGGYSDNVGIRVGQSVTPRLSNNDALELEKSIKRFNLDLKDLVYKEFLKSLKTDSYYKRKLVPFGANHTIELTVLEYDISDSLLNPSSTTKINLEMRIVDKTGKSLYVNNEIGFYTFVKSSEVFNKKDYLKKILKQSTKNASSKLLHSIKKD